MKALYGVILLALAAPVLAITLGNTATVSFVIPDTRVNGDPLPYTEIKLFEMQCGDKVTIITSDQGSTGKYVIPTSEMLPGPGNYTCSMKTVDTQGIKSVASAGIEVYWAGEEKLIPLAPTDITTEW
jgi:hypothetical protein